MSEDISMWTCYGQSEAHTPRNSFSTALFFVVLHSLDSLFCLGRFLLDLCLIAEIGVIMARFSSLNG